MFGNVVVNYILHLVHSREQGESEGIIKECSMYFIVFRSHKRRCRESINGRILPPTCWGRGNDPI